MQLNKFFKKEKRLLSLDFAQQLKQVKFSQEQISNSIAIVRDTIQVVLATFVIENFNQSQQSLAKIIIGLLASLILWFITHLLSVRINST